MSSRFDRLVAAAIAGASCLAMAQAVPSAEQERVHLVQYLQKRFPGTGPQDWALGYDGLSATSTTIVTAIPFNDEHATNSADMLAIGKKLWEKKFSNGKGFAHCFPNAGRRVAVNYPQFDPKAKQVVTLEMALDRCLALHGEKTIGSADVARLAPLSAFLRSLAENQRLAVRVSTPAARERFDAGRTLYTRRIGDLNLACASCHVLKAGNLYGERGLSAAIGQTVGWPRLQPGGALRTLQQQFQSCFRRTGAVPPELGSDELNTLEYYLTFLSNGLPLRPLQVHR